MTNKNGGLFRPLIFATVLFLSSCSTNSILTNEDIVVMQKDSKNESEFTEIQLENKSEAIKNTEYNITLKVDPIKRTVNGVEKVLYRNNTGKKLESIYLNSYVSAFNKQKDETKANENKPYFEQFEKRIFNNKAKVYTTMKIESIISEEKELKFSQSETVIKVDLLEPLEVSDEIEFSLTFNAYIPEINHRTGADEDSMWFGNFLPTVAVFDKNGWNISSYYKAGDPFFSNLATFNVNIFTPKDYTVTATGEESSVVENELRKTNIKTTLVRDFAFAVSKEPFVETLKTSSGIYINFYTKQKIANAESILEKAGESVEYFGELLGTYPYSSIDIVETGLFFETIMEYPQIIFIDSECLKSDKVVENVVHGISHQWFYGIVGNDSINEPWLDEAFASILTKKIMYKDGNLEAEIKKDYNQLTYVLSNLKNKSVTSDVSVYGSWNEYYYMAYSKPSLMLFSLEHKLGEEKFKELIKTYYNKYAFKVAYSSDFVGTAEEVSGVDLDEFFKSWLYSEDLPPLYELFDNVNQY